VAWYVPRPQQKRTSEAPKSRPCVKRISRIVVRAEPLITSRRPMSVPHDWNQPVSNLPGVVEGGMLGRKDSESVEPLGGRLGAVCTAKAFRISR
jgi:hypothetical protein